MSAQNHRAIRIFSFTGVPLMVLLVAFFALSRDAAHDDLASVEAHNLWVIRDVESLEPASPGDFARVLLANFREAFMRTRADQLLTRYPYLIILDFWTIPPGDSVLSARMLSIFMTLVAAAIIYRTFAKKGFALPTLALMLVVCTNPLVRTLLREINTVGFWLLVIAIVTNIATRRLTSQADTVTRRSYRLSQVGVGLVGVIVIIQLFALGGATNDWRTAVDHLNQMRVPTEPAITDFNPRSAAAYYDLRYGLKRGLALDLSWQTPDSLKMLDYIAKLTRSSGPVWVMMPAAKFDEAGWNVGYALTAAGRAPDVCLTIGATMDENRMIFARYVVSESRSQLYNCDDNVP